MFKLNIGKKSFDMVLSGVQKEVYVQDIPYNEEELVALWGRDTSGWKNPQRVTLTESEEEDARFALAVCTLAKGEGWPEWGAQKDVIYFILKIQKLEASCEVVAEEEKAEDPIAEPEAVEVPVAEPEEVKPEEEKKVEVTVEDVKKSADELAKAAAEVTVATGEATKAIEKAAPVIAETVPVVGAVKAGEEPVAKEPVEEKKAEEKAETVVKAETPEEKKEKAEANE